MQNVSCEPWTLYPSENPSSKLGYFQAATSSPYRVCIQHKAINKKTNLVLYDKKHFLYVKNLLLRNKKHFLRSSDVVYNSVLEVDTFTVYLYP